mgnify:CR=1 FL=1
MVNKIIQGYSLFLSKALYDINQLKNENYLSVTIRDEEHIRNAGPFDRLNEEGAYEIIRVGKSLAGNTSELTVTTDPFPSYPVTLQAELYSDTLTVSSTDQIETFNINNFILNASKNNVSKLTAVTFIYNDGRDNYSYDIETLGYQILSSRYDPDYGFSYLTLEDNQFRLSETVLGDSEFSTKNIQAVNISYEYKNL